MKFKAGDERVKNEGAIIARTVEKIAGETTAAATPERPTPVKAEQAPGLEEMEENQRFQTYLQHLEAQRHQFTMYRTSKDVDFPDSLLQQFKFEEAKEEAPVDKGKNAAVGKKRE